jgi:8-oxo-dGTP pyrophosphatase MutT (NUDIX family)
MRVSCGVILATPEGWLICHSTGNKHWDFPKGVADEGETHKAAALRELREETSFVIDAEKLTCMYDLGQHPYTKGKELHLFYCFYSTPIDPTKLVCESLVERPNYSFPEMDAFEFVSYDVALEKLSKIMCEWVKANVAKALVAQVLCEAAKAKKTPAMALAQF